MKTNEVYLRHILDAIRKVESYTSGIDRDAFETDDMRQDAVIRQIEIIGEASRQLSDDFQEEHDSIPWSDIIGMRNRIAHDYMNVDLDIVWEVIHHDLPTLKSSVQRLLSE
jgi:uncharacterized protein with HEPN domain